MADYIEIGKIINTHGVRGHVKVMPFTDYPERFRKMKHIFLQKRNGELKEYGIEEVKYVKNTILLKLQGVNDMDQAQLLKDTVLVVERKDAVKLPKDTYYIFDLLGCSVYEDQECLGVVTDVLQTGSNDVYVVKDENEKELLIPALGWVVLSVDIAQKKIQVQLPKGLREL